MQGIKDMTGLPNYRVQRKKINEILKKNKRVLVFVFLNPIEGIELFASKSQMQPASICTFSTAAAFNRKKYRNLPFNVTRKMII